MEGYYQRPDLKKVVSSEKLTENTRVILTVLFPVLLLVAAFFLIQYLNKTAFRSAPIPLPYSNTVSLPKTSTSIPSTQNTGSTQTTPPDKNLLILENDTSVVFTDSQHDDILRTLSQAYAESDPTKKYQDFKTAYAQVAAVYQNTKDVRFRLIADDIYTYVKTLSSYRAGEISLL